MRFSLYSLFCSYIFSRRLPLKWMSSKFTTALYIFKKENAVKWIFFNYRLICIVWTVAFKATKVHQTLNELMINLSSLIIFLCVYLFSFFKNWNVFIYKWFCILIIEVVFTLLQNWNNFSILYISLTIILFLYFLLVHNHKYVLLEYLSQIWNNFC